MDASCLLVAGDETAVPAICAIVESLPAGQRARVLLEVAEAADALTIAAAVVDALAELANDLTPSPVAALEDVDVDSGILWDVPTEELTPTRSSGVCAWLAGEAAVVKGLRRHLVQEVGIDRRSVAFMGYWREGRDSD